ncbi:hypothetical protein SDC9_142644 [bioreactor metagenome]|uniref:HTH-type transcriptional regulatory protein GabR n=1 Tax=bioreactor metagenome TaxID=1076179 RepID=A0A645E151_9ZZZZ
MTQFITTGQFAKHLGRMRRLYRTRQHLLREAIATHFAAVPHQVRGGDSGMHLTVKLPHHYPDTQICAAAQAYDMAPAPLSRFALKPSRDDNGLVLGYGNTAEARISALIKRLALLTLSSGT